MAYHACLIVIRISCTADPMNITSRQPISNFLKLIIIGILEYVKDITKINIGLIWLRLVKNVTKIDTRYLVLLKNARNKILWLS